MVQRTEQHFTHAKKLNSWHTHNTSSKSHKSALGQAYDEKGRGRYIARWIHLCVFQFSILLQRTMPSIGMEIYLGHYGAIRTWELFMGNEGRKE